MCAQYLPMAFCISPSPRCPHTCCPIPNRELSHSQNGGESFLVGGKARPLQTTQSAPSTRWVGKLRPVQQSEPPWGFPGSGHPAMYPTGARPVGCYPQPIPPLRSRVGDVQHEILSIINASLLFPVKLPILFPTGTLCFVFVFVFHRSLRTHRHPGPLPAMQL